MVGYIDYHELGLTIVIDFEVEQDEMSRANPPVHLTRELWVRLKIQDLFFVIAFILTVSTVC